jgi:hypothetical protein
MERPDPVPITDERVADSHDPTLPPPLSHERRSRWGDRRQEPDA